MQHVDAKTLGYYSIENDIASLDTMSSLQSSSLFVRNNDPSITKVNMPDAEPCLGTNNLSNLLRAYI